jgi:hypothetical protein
LKYACFPELSQVIRAAAGSEYDVERPPCSDE